MNELDKKIDEYSARLEIEPNDHFLYGLRAEAYRQKGELALAMDDCNKCLNIVEEQGIAYSDGFLLRAFIHLNLGEIREAELDFNSAVDYSSNNDALFARARFYNEQGRLSESLKDYDMLVAMKPDYWMFYFNRGAVLQEKNELEMALADYAKVIALKPEDPRAYYNSAVIFHDSNMLEQAVAGYTKAIEKYPEMAIAYINRSDAYKTLNEPEKSQADLETALRIDPALVERLKA